MTRRKLQGRAPRVLAAFICIAIRESFLWLRKFSLEAHSARSADFQSAVSPNFIRPGVGICEALLSDRRPADCKSAIQRSAAEPQPNGVRTSSGAGTRVGNLCEGAILSTRACRSSCGRRRPHSGRFALPVSNAEEQSAAKDHPALKRNEFGAPKIVAGCDDLDRY